MTLDYLSIVSEQSTRTLQVYRRDSRAAIPWSTRWTVGTVARHVAGTHHVVAGIVRGRPDADFGLFNSLQTPAKDAPEFLEWCRSGTASLLEQLSSVPSDEACWSWYPDGRSVGWWARRMAFEAVIHRWDVEAAIDDVTPIPADVAADGIDEYLDVFVASSRAANNSPAGPTISFACTDRGERWWLDLSQQGGRAVTTEPRAASIGLRGSAEQLLLTVWGRTRGAVVEIDGDASFLDRWPELIPPI